MGGKPKRAADKRKRTKGAKMRRTKAKTIRDAEMYFESNCHTNIKRLSRRKVTVKTLEKVRETQLEMRATIYQSLCLINDEHDNKIIRHLKDYYEQHGRLTYGQFDALITACCLKSLQQYYFDIYGDID